MPRLVGERLGKQFGRRLLFRELSFALEGGRSLAVTGANGAGKSTLLRLLAGVLSPTAGQVRLEVGGAAVAQAEQPLQVGLVAPYLNVYDGFTARENLAFLAQARRLPRAGAAVEAELARVGLAGRADDLVRTFSSGMKQRVKYAAALLATPPLLLLDEPSANLDVAGLDMVARVMARQTREGRLLVVATNDAAEAERCDAALRIEDFRPAKRGGAIAL